MLIVRLTLPIADDEMSQDVLDLFASLRLSSVANEAIGCSSSADVVLKRVDELLLALDTINISYHGGCSNKELRTDRSVVNGWCVSTEVIRGKILVSTVDVQSREWCLIGLLHVRAHGSAVELRGRIPCLLNGGCRQPSEFWSQCFEVDGSCSDLSFIDLESHR